MKAILPLVLVVNSVLACTATPVQPVVDTQVIYVRTVGTWQIQEQYGAYRVVLSRVLNKLVTMQLRVEWIDYSRGPGMGDRIIRTEILYASFRGDLEIESVTKSDGGITVDVNGEREDDSKISCHIVLRPTGVHSKSAQC